MTTPSLAWGAHTRVGQRQAQGLARVPVSPLSAKEGTRRRRWQSGAWRRCLHRRGLQPGDSQRLSAAGKTRFSLTHAAVGRAPLSPSAAPQEASAHAHCLPLGFRIMEAKNRHTSWELHPGAPPRHLRGCVNSERRDRRWGARRQRAAGEGGRPAAGMGWCQHVHSRVLCSVGDTGAESRA